MESGSVETLAFGHDRPPRAARWRLPALGVVAALVLGYLAGERAVTGFDAGGEGADARGVVLVAGSVREARTASGDAAFEVLLHNAGPSPVSVVLLAVGPVPVPARKASVVALPGEGQGAAAFTVVPTCAFDPEAAFATVAVRVVRGPGAGDHIVLPLLEPGSLPEYTAALCSDARPPDRADLVGVWLLEDAYGRWADAEGVQLLHFEDDGSFASDARGHGLGGRVAVRGRWRLEGDTLETRVVGGYACPHASTGVWRVGVRTHRMLDLRNVRGTCPYDPGGVWALRKLGGGSRPALPGPRPPER